eukprot:m51a1_g971 hypothetical protein (513) ;mRNA; f:386500-388304
MNSVARSLTVCLAVLAATPGAHAAVTSIVDLDWSDGWDPREHYVSPAIVSSNFSATFAIRGNRTSEPNCTATLSFSADGSRLAAGVEAIRYKRHWWLEVTAALGVARLVAAAPGNATLAVACADAADSSRAAASGSWSFVLGTCGDLEASECVASSATNGACAVCGGRCVPMPADLRAANCSVCGDGLVGPGEQCEQSLTAFCSATCACVGGSYAKGDGTCAARVVFGVLAVRSAPLAYSKAQSVAAAVARRCMAHVAAGAALNASDVVLAQSNWAPRLLLRVAARPGAPRNASTPRDLVRAVSSECAEGAAADEGLQATWRSETAAPGCGDGVVAGGEQCDSTAYCSPTACACAEGSRAERGLCVAEALYVGYITRERVAGDGDARGLAAQLTARCFDYGEVALAEAAASSTQPVVRVVVVPVARPLPGARTPRAAIDGEYRSGSECVAQVLREAGLTYLNTDTSADPDAIPGFGPATSSEPRPVGPSGSAGARAAGALVTAALGALAATL